MNKIRKSTTYRGVIVNWRLMWEGSQFAAFAAGALLFTTSSTRTRKNPPTRNVLRHRVDLNWPAITRNLHRVRSCDGLPWELHAIEDKKTRNAAIGAFESASRSLSKP